MFSIPLSFLLYSIEFLQLYFSSLIFSSAVSYLRFKTANASYILTVSFFFSRLILYLLSDVNSLFLPWSYFILFFKLFSLTLHSSSPTWFPSQPSWLPSIASILPPPNFCSDWSLLKTSWMFSLDYKKYACLTALLPSSFYLNVTIQHRASLVAQMIKSPSAMWEIWVQSLGREDPLKEGMANHSSILAWRIPTDRGAWQATVHGVAKSWTRLSD